MSALAAEDVRAVTGGRWLRRPPPGRVPAGIGTDTRESLRHAVFAALRGERHDGHDHLSAAAAAGAVLAIVDREPASLDGCGDMGVLLVADTRRALARLALAHRRRLVSTKVIAITGSCGKTTTKGMIDGVLSTVHAGSVAPRSFNNDVGVPLTIFAGRPHHKYLVVELGTNTPGEIASLAAIAEPDIAVLTNVGRAHLEGFGTVAAVAEEKASLLAHLRPDGVAIVNADCGELEPYARTLTSVVRFGESDDADLRLTNRGRGRRGWWFEVNGRLRFDLSLAGRHNAVNALAAVAIGRRFGLSDARISDALATVEPEPMRMEPREIGGVRVYNDAYNANPDSMIAALETFIEAAADARRRIVVLGDMLELGPEAAALHRELGRHVIDVDTRCRIDEAVLVGPLATHIAAAVRRVWPERRLRWFAEATDDAVDEIARSLRPGDAVLLKASRRLGLERVVDGLEQVASGARRKGGPLPFSVETR
jgi:UDP-N-acetylmuramoyl-tripeptide--D-alanyl-D-alanine ligase